MDFKVGDKFDFNKPGYMELTGEIIQVNETSNNTFYTFKVLDLRFGSPITDHMCFSKKSPLIAFMEKIE